MSIFHHRRPEKGNKKKKFKLDKEARQRIEAEFDDTDLDGYTNYDMPEEVRPKRKWLRKLIFGIVMLCGLILAVNIGLLLFTGQLWFNEPRKRDYPVRGPVISESEGKVNWNKFSQQNIQMAYIRATKSTAYEDKNFGENKSGANETDLPVGALHVFDLTMDGKEQAEHFCETVGNLNGWLIPAVEVRVTGFYRIIPVDYDEASEHLLDFADEIERVYGVRPIIKCDKKTYKNIACREEFDNCPIWYESEYSEIDSDIRWDFWGYSSRVKFAYYESGGYLEMVLYKGSEEDFSKMYI